MIIWLSIRDKLSCDLTKTRLTQDAKLGIYTSSSYPLLVQDANADINFLTFVLVWHGLMCPRT